jgi:hypothetical protein
MAVMTERPSWSDQRLDDLSMRMDEGFRRNDVEHQEFRREMKAGFDAMNESMNARFDRLQQTLIVIGAGLIGTLIAASTTLVVALA